jgi:hypothetical protein
MDGSSVEGLVRLFEAIGIDGNRAKETVKNKKFSAALYEVIHEVSAECGGMGTDDDL